MSNTEPRSVHVLFGRQDAVLRLPPAAAILRGQDVPALADAAGAIRSALGQPIGTLPLAQLLRARAPRSVAITVSDITRPVPNREFLPALLAEVQAAGIPAKAVTIVIGTGMHRPSTAEERERIVGPETLAGYAVVDHRADAPETLVRIRETPPLRVCKRFAEAEFRIVTGYIEPHFMAGFSGGRKGVCPALVDLATVQRFHGYETLSDPRAENGVLEGNPCHRIALEIARLVGVDFLLNVALTRDRRIAGVYAGDLVQAHLAGCRQVGAWTCAPVEAPFDLLVTTGGGYPLDQTFYQTVKGMCGALPALGPESTLVVLSHCGEGLGSESYSRLLFEYGRDWRRFLADAAARPGETRLDQWQLQMQCRVLQRIGSERLLVATDGVPEETLSRLAVSSVPGPGTAPERAQRLVADFAARNPAARVAIVPEGPYTMLVRQDGGATGSR
jgi:nickel-dependent lactate racemase